MTGPIIDGGSASTTYTGTATTSGPVYAPDITTYATRTPYITPAEFLEAGTGVDVSQLIPGDSTQADQNAALTRVIARASSWADTYCRQVLAATSDIQAGMFRVQVDGSLAVPVAYTPLISVTDVAVGVSVAGAAPLADLSMLGLSRKVVTIPASAYSSGFACAWASSTRRYVAVTYVNGWANTTLSAPVTAGATTLTVANPLGLYPGVPLTIDDGGSTEQVDVLTVVGSLVTLSAPLADGHATGVAVSALPQAIKQAVILLTASLIRTRGASAIVLNGLSGQPEQITASEPGGTREQQLAYELLGPYRRAR